MNFMVCESYLKAIFFKDCAWRNRGPWLIYLHLPLALPCRTKDLGSCLESFTSILLSLYIEKGSKERTARDLELEYELVPESGFLVSHSKALSVVYSKVGTLH